MADTITFDDKVQGQTNPNPANKKFTYEDANEIKTVVNSNAGETDTNASNISTNASNISTNTTNIATNTADISTNTADIATNTSNISTNASDISTNASNISANASNISTNTTDIATNATNITTAQSTADAALPKAGGEMTGAITGDQSARLYTPQSDNNIIADTNLSLLTENTTILINTVAASVTITVDDTANSLPIGTRFEFIWRVGSNDVTFTTSGSQIVLSADDNLKLRTRYCAAVLTKQFNNTWYLIGDLKA